MDAARAHAIISGRVQGVFFRASACDEATERGLKGFVRNLPDGRVEAIFEGERYLVEEMLEWCRRGPPGSSVDDVDVEWLKARSEFTGFSTRY